MSPNLHWQLLQPRRFFLGLCQCVVYTIQLPGFVGERGFPKTAFQWWCIGLPLTFGILLSSMLHEPMHRPFARLLPNARRHFARSHLLVLAVIALGCSALACAMDRTLPFFAILAVAMTALTLPLPAEPGWRWAGSRPLLWIVLLAGFFGTAFGTTVKAFVVAQPWLTASAGLALTAINLALGFSPARLRSRASIPYLPFFTTVWDPEFRRKVAAEHLARQTSTTGPWQPDAKRDSLRYWVRVVQHEARRGGKGFSASRRVIVAVMILLSISLTMPGFGSGMADHFYQLVCVPGAVKDQSKFQIFLFIMIFVAQATVAPRPEWLYPLARARRAQVAYAASLWQIASSFAFGVGIVVAAAWGVALWRGLEVNLAGTFAFIVSLAAILPFVPFAQWGRMHAHIREDHAMHALCMLLGVVAATTAYLIIHLVLGDISTLAQAGLILLGIGASQTVYYAALRRFYLKGDLLQRGSKRQNFSLI